MQKCYLTPEYNLVQIGSCLHYCSIVLLDSKAESNTGPFIILGLIFCTSLVAMAFVYLSFPELRQ